MLKRIALAILAAFVIGTVAMFATGTAKVYNGLNKGVVVGNCGVEIVGEPGPFCNTNGGL